MSHLRGHGVRVATPVVAGPRLTAPPAPSGGTREHGNGPVKLDLWEHAACRGQGNQYGNVWMYPDLHPRWVVKAAASLCQTCPVIDLCRAEGFRFGISAGVVRYSERANRFEPQPVGVPAEKECRCGTWFRGSKAHCSQRCLDATTAERVARRERFAALSTKPILELLEPLARTTSVAELCGVSTRTVFRWRAGATVSLLQAERIARRLGVDVESLWPETAHVEPLTANVRDIRTAHSCSTRVTHNINEADDATTTSRPRPLTDLTGGPLMSIVDTSRHSRRIDPPDAK